jgi:hypothetical protein
VKFLTRRKDGGPESSVTGYWLVEIKSLFSVCLLRFDGRSREAFHTHAFHCLSWVLRGALIEHFLAPRGVGSQQTVHRASWRPFITRRSDFHKVDSLVETTWVLTFRGPWAREWKEFLPMTDEFVTLTSGRAVSSRTPARSI